MREMYRLAPTLTRSIERNLDGVDIGVDLDSVTQLTAWAATLNMSHELHRLNNKFVRQILVNELISYWELAEIAKRNGVPEDKALGFAKAAWNRHEVYRNSPAVQGAPTLLRILRDIRTCHKFISARPDEFKATTDEWFDEIFSWVSFDDVLVNRPDKMSGEEFKVININKFGIDLHLDDSLEESVAIAENTRAVVVVVPQPWNMIRRLNHPKIKQFDTYDPLKGLWQVIGFLASDEVKNLLSVAQ